MTSKQAGTIEPLRTLPDDGGDRLSPEPDRRQRRIMEPLAIIGGLALIIGIVGVIVLLKGRRKKVR